MGEELSGGGDTGGKEGGVENAMLQKTLQNLRK